MLLFVRAVKAQSALNQPARRRTPFNLAVQAEEIARLFQLRTLLHDKIEAVGRIGAVQVDEVVKIVTMRFTLPVEVVGSNKKFDVFGQFPCKMAVQIKIVLVL